MKYIIGIMPQEEIRERVLTIASGEYVPHEGEPKLWFPSVESMIEEFSKEE